MNELKMSLKTKNFVVNPLILKNIKKLNIELNELLLIIYFINVKNEFDIDDIEKIYDLDKESILTAFNSLINKKLIEIVMLKNNNNIDEEISLDILYNKLLMNIDNKKEKDENIFSKFESEFGRTLSPIEYETINNWLEKDIKEETILKALKEAVINGVNNLRYIDKILYEWKKKGINSKEDIEKNRNDFQNRKVESKPLFDYDWLNDNE